ncbi:tyrosine recombinase XerC [Nocardia sp. NPDC059180]|uniref:site-specific integrase n=1 Tax=Nocardia sp. NPDC059180 TaxID=3346761 RepID=UPI0036748AF8
MITAGIADRAVGAWIADGAGRSTIKNTLAALGPLLDQAVQDEIIDRNRGEVSGWQSRLAKYEDELDDPRALALPDRATLQSFSEALVTASADNYRGWGDVVILAACTATRIGEVSGCLVSDIDTDSWLWTLRRQTTPGPGGLKDKGTKGKRARRVPVIEEIRPLVLRRIDAAGARVASRMKDAAEEDRAQAVLNERLFVGPRGGRIATGVLRRATNWDEVVAQLGYEHLRRHDLRHTGLTWFADSGVPLHRLQVIAGHTDPRITQKYLHPDIDGIRADGDKLSRHLRGEGGPRLAPAFDGQRNANGRFLVRVQMGSKITRLGTVNVPDLVLYLRCDQEYAKTSGANCSALQPFRLANRLITSGSTIERRWFLLSAGHTEDGNAGGMGIRSGQLVVEADFALG